MSSGFAPLRGESKKDSGRLSLKAELTETPITESDHHKIQADLQKDDRYCFLLSEIEDDRERKETIMEEMKENLKKLAVLHAKRKSLDDIKGALRRGEKLHREDQEIWDEGEANILAEYEATKQEDKKLRQEKIEVAKMIVHNEAELKRYALEELKLNFSYTKAGRFYQIGRGSRKLEQEQGESLREIGICFRRLITDAKKMRTLQYSEAYEIVHRYDKAAGQGHEDFPTMQRILRQMRENPLMSRFEWCTLVKDLCDERLLDDFVKTIDGITQGSDEGSQDMRNSLDPEECVQQEVNQDRSRPQREMQNAAKYHKMKRFFKNDEERERFSILVQGAGANRDGGNFSGGNGQKRKSGSFKRGGKKHKKEGESFQRPDQGKGSQRRPWKNGKKNKEGFRPVADQNK